jgi:hypothetical protein
MAGLAFFRRRLALLAFLALAFAFAYPMQVNGFNQTAHYALVRSLAVHHVPNIDRSRGEVGDLSTGDAALYEGHYYATRPPGLAAATLPAFFVLEAVGMRTVGDPTRVIWALHLWSIALAGLALLLLVAWVAERLEPGLGVAAAVTVGLGTLVLPFSTLFFSHVPSALLGFAAFAVLFRERQREPRLALVAGAGVLAGLAITFEYPLVLVAGIVGLYALVRPDRLRRALAYGGGVLAGVLPLLAFNVWAFRDPLHIAHEDFFQSREHRSEGILGFSLPSPQAAFDLLFSSMGLLVMGPVAAAGVVGAALLYRRPGRRAEAVVLLVIPVAYLLYTASLKAVSPFGGLGPPRYLVTILPFVGVGLALAYRAFPLTTLALALVSVFQQVVTTATGPLAAYDGDWLGRLRRHDFVQTGASIVEVTGWYTIAPFFLAVLLGGIFALAASRHPHVARAELPLAVGAVVVWALVALAAENPNGAPPGTGYVTAAAALLVALAALLAWRYGRGPWLPRALGAPRGQRA